MAHELYNMRILGIPPKQAQTYDDFQLDLGEAAAEAADEADAEAERAANAPAAVPHTKPTFVKGRIYQVQTKEMGNHEPLLFEGEFIGRLMGEGRPLFRVPWRPELVGVDDDRILWARQIGAGDAAFWYLHPTLITPELAAQFKGLEGKEGKYAVTFVTKDVWDNRRSYDFNTYDQRLNDALETMNCRNSTVFNDGREEQVVPKEHILTTKQVAELDNDPRFARNETFSASVEPLGVVSMMEHRFKSGNAVDGGRAVDIGGPFDLLVIGNEYTWATDAVGRNGTGVFKGLDEEGMLNFEMTSASLGLAVGDRVRFPASEVVRMDLAHGLETNARFASSDAMVKEAMSRRDLAATIVALMSFLMLPGEIRDQTDIDAWLSSRGGSLQTAQGLAKAVGKPDPASITPAELKATRKRLEAVTNEGYWMGRDKSHRRELDKKTEANAADLLKRVNALLKDLGVERIGVHSGWRPRSYNEELIRKGYRAAKNSRHITGQAVDIEDSDGSLARKLLKNPDLLRRHGLWIENPKFTRGWVHLDSGFGVDNKSRMFNP